MSTKIPYCDEVWNPVIGCTKCSPGCKNCYAEKMARRLAYMGQEKYTYVIKARAIDENRPWNNKVFCDESALDIPLHRRKPRKILTCSMGDLFHEKVPFEYIDQVRGIMRRASQHTYLVLTKRLKRLYEYCEVKQRGTWPKHIHLGVSISTQAEADEKIPILLQIPAAVRWISVEPMLEGISFRWKPYQHQSKGETYREYLERKGEVNHLESLKGISWVVIGAESINGRVGRLCKLEWVRSIVNQCKTAGVPVWVKQLHINGKLIRDIDKFPEDLRLREPVARQKGR